MTDTKELIVSLDGLKVLFWSLIQLSDHRLSLDIGVIEEKLDKTITALKAKDAQIADQLDVIETAEIEIEALRAHLNAPETKD